MFKDLRNLAAGVADRRMLDLFADPGRAEAFSIRACDMLFDFSKTQIDARVKDALLALAESRGVAAKRDAMFAGAKINETEGRAVLHTALRNLSGKPVMVDGHDVMPEVLSTLDKMSAVADEVRASGVTDVVNIGIGGSDLGPAMAYRALTPYCDGPRCH
ncbi:MAG: glucose-6-phosphate isomerase, partial [Roseivivax sp.]|nr:glucose-6-phosphate isomerase [Roseivivax sp.]